MTAHRWPAGAATGIGSMPGTDPAEATTTVFGELPDLPHLPELPERGAGGGILGRTAALLVELPVEIVPSGWRIAAHPGRDAGRSRDLLARDLDALEERADGWTGALKIQLAGPWTLAAGLELPNGHKVLADHGAVRDLTESLTEGLRLHVADVASRVPGAQLVVQLDEPSLPAAMAARIPTPSGFGTLRAVAAPRAEQALQDVLAAAPEGGRVVHCCAPDVPVALLVGAGADALALDAALLTRGGYDALGEAVDAGTSLWLGVVPTAGREAGTGDALRTVQRLWSDLGFGVDVLAAGVVPTPACGLAGVAPERARRALRTAREVGRSLLDEEDPAEGS